MLLTFKRNPASHEPDCKHAGLGRSGPAGDFYEYFRSDDQGGLHNLGPRFAAAARAEAALSGNADKGRDPQAGPQRSPLRDRAGLWMVDRDPGLAGHRRVLSQPRIAPGQAGKRIPSGSRRLFARVASGSAMRGGPAATLLLRLNPSTLTFVERRNFRRFGTIRGARIACRRGFRHCQVGSG